MRLTTYRRTSQIVFTILTLGGLFGVGTTGIIYPYFFCYSCPWDVGACPIGILEHSFIDIQLTGLMVGLVLLLFLFGFMSLMSVLFGRAFCGWACPMGLLQDLSKKLGISKKLKKKIKPKIDPRVKYIKYIIFISIPITSYITLSLFFTTFCPIGGITGTVPTLTFYSADWLLGTTFPLKFTSIALFVLLIVLVTRGWCKYLCPLGAWLAPWNKISTFKIKRDEETCNNCKLCERSCPMDIKDIGRKTDTECILCARCIPSCRKDSLKLASRFNPTKKGIIPYMLVIIISASMMLSGVLMNVGIGEGDVTVTGYDRVDAINAIPCLGCLALDPKSPEGWFSVQVRIGEDVLPDFIMEQLAEKPVIIDYRTTVCSACDEMDPHVEALKEQYGDRVFFFKHNKEDKTQSNFENLDDMGKDSDEYLSYFIFDVLGSPGQVDLSNPGTIKGVPLFPIITYGLDENGDKGIIFRALYGSSADGGYTQKANIAAALDEAINLYAGYNPGTIWVGGKNPFSELFVDLNCVHCFKSEDSFVELEHSGNTTYVTYVTDAPGISGMIGRSKELMYTTSLGGGGAHPWAVFGGGPDEELGAITFEVIKAKYENLIRAIDFEPINLSISGELTNDSGNQNLLLEMSIINTEDVEEIFFIEAFLVERESRWLNLQGHPIPNAVVDLLVNDTYTLQSGEEQVFNVSWDGTDALNYSDMRLGNIQIVVVVWKDGKLVTSEIIRADVKDAMWLEIEEPFKATVVDGSAIYTLTLFNNQDKTMDFNLSVGVPSNWITSLSSQSMTLGPTPIDSNIITNEIFTLTITGNGTTVGDLVEFEVKAEDVTDVTLFATTKVHTEVRGEITPPIIVQPIHTPELPSVAENITISASIGDDSNLQGNPILAWYSCDDISCSPVKEINMTFDGDYTATVNVLVDYPNRVTDNIFHYQIKATDIWKNEKVTEWFDFELEPLEVTGGDGDGPDPGGGTSKFNTYGIPFLLIFVMVAIGLVAAGKTTKPKKPKSEKPQKETEEPDKKPLKHKKKHVPVQKSESELDPMAHVETEPGIKHKPESELDPMAHAETVPTRKPPVKRPPVDKSEMLERIEKAYKEGKMSEEQYLKNIAKFKK